MHLFVFVCIFGCIKADLVVNTSSGPIQGTSSLVEDVEAFLGIPYAEPPVGELRFVKPIPKQKWILTYNASHLPPPCSQFDVGTYYYMPDITNMSEDCLYLNVWTPKSKFAGYLRPVIIYFHPGAFLTGSSNLMAHDGSKLASHGDVVVVTVNYRLGAFGYFFADTEDAEGNMGMYDQIMAIKWVKENAERFGGDPENIVLMGVSAGAISVAAHMVSPLSKHLFNKAIIQSGSIVHTVFLDDNAKLFENSQSIASLVGCANGTVTLRSDPGSIMKCLKSTSVEKIVQAEKKLMFENLWEFYPRVNDEFLPKSSVDLLREGKFRADIDVLAGVTNDEGPLLLFVVLQDFFGRYGEKNETTLTKMRTLTFLQSLLLTLKEPNATRISRYYLNQVKDRSTIGYTKTLANILGDMVVTCSTLFFADLVSLKGNSVYFYKFGFRSPSTPMADWVGATHLDDVQYIFGNPYHQNFTAEETELSHRMIERWSAFARTGNPNIPGHMPWLRYSYHNPLYLSFGQEEESLRMKPVSRCELWRDRFKADVDDELIQTLQNSRMTTKNSFSFS